MEGDLERRKCMMPWAITVMGGIIESRDMRLRPRRALMAFWS